MDEPAQRVRGDNAEQPENEKDDENGPEHCSLVGGYPLILIPVNSRIGKQKARLAAGFLVPSDICTSARSRQGRIRRG